MGKKVNLFHREIEVKVLLEVLGVYGVLALVLVGAYYLEPTITGFVAIFAFIFIATQRERPKRRTNTFL